MCSCGSDEMMSGAIGGELGTMYDTSLQLRRDNGTSGRPRTGAAGCGWTTTAHRASGLAADRDRRENTELG